MILCVFMFCFWSGSMADMSDSPVALPLAGFSPNDVRLEL